MTEYDLIEQMKLYAKDQIDGITLNMKRGGCIDHAAYTSHVGKISSLELMLNFLEDLEKKFLEQ